MRLSIMLKHSSTGKNRVITRLYEDLNDIPQPLKTPLDKQFAGKKRAKTPW